MHNLYIFLTGPGAWIAFSIFLSGILFRFISLALLARKKDQVVYSYMSFKYALRSLFHWMLPFGSKNMRLNPGLTLISFLFHLSMLMIPLFLSAHIILINQAFNINWHYLPDMLCDLVSMGVIASCLFFMWRRLFVPEVNYLTSCSDYLVLAIVAAPFITGVWTHHQWPGFPLTGILHILSGEIMLAAIPFSKLSHMFFFPLTRGYMGSEFGSIKNAKDW